MNKKIQGILLLLTFFCGAVVAQTKKFTGMFFSVSYPAEFKVRNCPVANECNSASFMAPDKTVEFFIFSPQWNGEHGMEATATEKEVSRKVTEQKSGETVTEVTIEAINKSYTRSFYDSENKELNTRKTFGIKYKNITAYKKYKAKYLLFKKSLQQFAD
jgi:hypothetical protein